MASKYAVVDLSGNVVNVVLAEEGYDPGEGLALILLEGSSPVSPGDKWDGEQFHRVSRTPAIEDPPVSQELADAYEAIAMLYEETEALKARIAVLEGGVA